MIQWVKEPSGKVSYFMSGTLNLHFQKELLAPPKSNKAGQVKDLVASKLSAFFMLLPISKTKESLEIMWCSPLLAVGFNLSSIDNIQLSDMKELQMPPECHQNQWPNLR